MTNALRVPLSTAILCLVVSVGCLDRFDPIDDVSMCVLPAADRVVVRVAAGCAADHKGATLTCEIRREGDELVVTASGREGKDPNDGCGGELTAECESEPLDPGEYTVVFGDDVRTATVPGEAASCDTTGG